MQQALPPGPDQLVPEKKSKVNTVVKWALIVFAISMVADVLSTLGDTDTKTSTPPVNVPSAQGDTTSGSSAGITAEITAEMVVDAMGPDTVNLFCNAYYTTGDHDLALAQFEDGYGPSQSPSAEQVFDELLIRC